MDLEEDTTAADAEGGMRRFNFKDAGAAVEVQVLVTRMIDNPNPCRPELELQRDLPLNRDLAPAFLQLAAETARHPHFTRIGL